MESRQQQSSALGPIGSVALLLIGLLGSGCVGTHVLHRDKSFQLADFERSELAVAGVSGFQIDPDAPALVDGILRQRLSTAWPKVRLVPLEEVRTQLGPERHDRIVAESSEALGPALSDLQALSQSLGDVRFLLWIHLSGFHWNQYDSATAITETESNYNSKTNSWEETTRTVGYDLHAGVVGETEVTLSIYDARRGDFVWIGRRRSYAWKENSPDAMGMLQYPSAPAAVGGVVDATRVALTKLK